MTPANFQYHVLIDSDAFVGLLYPDDAHHAQCRQIFVALRSTRQQLVTTNLVVFETATVLSHRSGQALARQFLEQVVWSGKLDVVSLSEELQTRALELFAEQERRGTSVVDCANIVAMRHFDVPRIFSFDKVYAKHFGLKTAS